jgi:tetratricopeptide (TPR) repeat protein
MPVRLAVVLLATVFAHVLMAVEEPDDFAGAAKKRFLNARAGIRAGTNQVDEAWTFARCAFDWAEFATSDEQREEIALEGIDVSRKLVARKPELAAAHYYLAMNLVQLARTKSLGALKLVSEMEREFKTASQLDEKFDHAGPDRNLGMIYHEAPGWPTSIGSHKKARQHLERARELAPEFPENHLYLIEAYLKWGDTKTAARAFETLQKRWPEMKKQFSTGDSKRDWLDWNRRFSRLQNQFGAGNK